MPVAVAGGLAFGSLTAGSYQTCGLTSAGAAYCWGWNGWGQLGRGDTLNAATPVPVAGALTFTTLTAGFGHTCGLMSGGAAYCWGDNFSGQLGSTAALSLCSAHSYGGVWTLCSSAPVPVAGGLTFASLTAGSSNTCGVTAGGAAYCWGANSAGQLGRGDTGSAATPVPVAGALTFTTLTVGFGHTCGLTNGGAAYCWGDNLYGQLGNGTSGASHPTPVAVAGGLTFATLTAGGEHTCGLTSGGAAYCWGNNFSGQLGAANP